VIILALPPEPRESGNQRTVFVRLLPSVQPMQAQLRQSPSSGKKTGEQSQIFSAPAFYFYFPAIKIPLNINILEIYI